jgi:hypothetical protein
VDSRFGNGVLLIFLVVQALDGILTYVGLASVGRATEGNPLVASLMSTFGLGAGLVSAKLGASTLGVALHLSGTHRLVAVLTAIYFAAAILPWTAILATIS